MAASLFDFTLRAIIIGTGATLIFDLWGNFIAPRLGAPKTNWAMPGRWFAYLFKGRFAHHTIAQSPPIQHELAIGWAFHYAVGILFAAATLLIGGPDWAHAPSLAPAMVIGIGTVLCGWLILSPGLGFGWAGSAFPDAMRRRLFQLVAHVVFGFGLYASAVLFRGI